ncbi:MAG: transcriptional repressor LexA [Candidatus Paceibacterota bacterium]|jgi:site-specific DNA-methyltransferase (adenine-specific)
MSTLTPKQKQIFDYIKKYIRTKKYAPSLDDIGKHFHLVKSTVHQHILTLQQKGYLRKVGNQPRSIQLNDNKKISTLVNIPLLGTIAAGQPIEAIEDKEIIAIPKDKLPTIGNVFALRVAGSSMVDENIKDGDIVLIKQQSVAENGQKVVALIDGSEATLKKIYQEKNYIRLQPANRNFDSIIINRDRDIAIQGVVIDVISRGIDQTMNELLHPPKIKSYDPLPLNSIICGDATDQLKKIPDNSIDMVVTSPPYDGIRQYNGFSYDLHTTGQELYRVMKEGGVIAMVIQDQTKDFGKSLTSFRTIVDWCDNIGFKLFETVIYKKHGAEGAWWTKRFRVDHEYVPIFIKGKRPQFFDKEHLKIPSKHGGKTMTGCATRLTNGKTLKSKKVTINPLKCRGTIWDYTTCGDGTRLKHQHPATFPDRIPSDLIKCFCPPKGVVLDPFIGSGTTALAAIELGKKYIGIDISQEYCDLTRKRIKEEGKINSRLF